MTSATDRSWSGFEGIDPHGLRDLAATGDAASRALHEHARNGATAVALAPDAMAVGAVRRVLHVADDLHRWSTDLRGRADAIEAGQGAVGARVGAAIVSAVALTRSLAQAAGGELFGVGREVAMIRAGLTQRWEDWDVDGGDLRTMAGALSSLTGSERRSAVTVLGVPAIFRWVEELLFETGKELTATERTAHLTLIVDSLEIDELVMLVDILVGSGHGLDAVAIIGDAVAASSLDVVHLFDSVRRRLDDRDLAAGVLVGRALGTMAVSREPVVTIEAILGDAGSLGFVFWSASIHDQAGATSLFELTAAVGAVGDADLIARVVVELVAQTRMARGAVWLEALDRAIAELILKDPSGVIHRLRVDADIRGAAIVGWLQRLVGETHGPELVQGLVTGLLGPTAPDATWFAHPGVAMDYPNARDAGHVAGALVAAVHVEAARGKDTIATLGAMAVMGEAVGAMASSITAVVGALVPLAVGFGVEAVTRDADRQIDGAMAWLLGRIDERFEPDEAQGHAGLGSALLAFDEARDAMVEAWVP